ncbi:ABC transporter permease [Saccharopolyspora taberi]|uniref:ABC transporter permease n=1 Tax=Saccharopolyspora taberi TaxID=60895 RepID=UPI0031D668FF
MRRDGVARAVPRTRAGAGRVFKATAGIVLFLLVWELAPRIGLVDSIFLPPFSEVVGTWWELAADGQLWEHLGASLARSLAGFLIAVAVAVPLGVVIGWYRVVSDLLNPLLELFRNTAALALLPVFVLLLGLGETSKVSLIVFACTWPILLNTISGVRTVDPLLIKSARSMGFTPFPLFYKVVLPAVVPTVFTGIRLAGANSILVLVAAEMVGARAGLGYLINASQFNFQVPEMYAGIITISLLGLGFNQALVLAERRLSRWRA